MSLRSLEEVPENAQLNLVNVKTEIEARLGQPKGELHLTVIKGERDKPMDLSVGATK